MARGVGVQPKKSVFASKKNEQSTSGFGSVYTKGTSMASLMDKNRWGKPFKKAEIFKSVAENAFD